MGVLVDGVGDQGDANLGTPAISVLIADDHPLVLGGIRRALEGQPDIELIGEAHSGPELLAMIARRSPRLVLLDLNMPGVNGLGCIEAIAARWPEVKMVVLSACEDRRMINGALLAGASAYVVKSVMTMDLASVVRQASTGAVFHAPTGQPQMAGRADEPEREAGLTARERAILEAVASGLTTAAISKELWVSEHTVKFHLTNIYRKLGVSNRAGAIRYALERNVVGV